MATSSKRVSIKAYLLPYLEQVGEEMGCSDLTEIVCQLLVEHKRYFHKGFIPGSGLIQMPTPAQIQAIEKPGKGIDDEALAAQLSGFLDAA